MAPEHPDDEQWPDPPTDYNEFFRDLQTFYAERGTPLDVSAKVNGKHIDLYRLFQIVTARGGYDAVSSEKLAWRKIGQEFNLGQTNAAAYAFALKTTYYKNLAAYAIKRVHKQDPPPKEILEQTTAKGGDLLSRTLDNFRLSQTKEQITNGHDSDGSADDLRRTPKSERLDADEPGSGGGRVRGLRQAPPQRVMFQPDLTSSRQVRQHRNNTLSPQPAAVHATQTYAYNATSNPNSSSFSVASYEPRPSIALTLRSAVTPSNNTALFKEKVRRLHEAHLAKIGKAPPPKATMLPGTGFDGPNIYIRTLNALRSGIPQEQDYALHHLVKISHERGDKFKFEAFPGLREGLTEKALEIGSLFYDVKWEISYADDGSARAINVLDGMNGTADILDRIGALKALDTNDHIETESFSHNLLKCNEAGLVIRNMCMLEENAAYLSEHCPLRDFLTIALNLPQRDCLVEMKHYALDIAEQLTKYWSIDSTDPLYTSLLRHLGEGLDRGAALTALRAISRISMNLEEPNRLKDVPLKVLTLLLEWTYLDDEELVGACLDFFYQYTAVPDNVALLMTGVAEGVLPLIPFIQQLGRLLLHNTLITYQKRLVAPAIPAPSATEIPNLPEDMVESVMGTMEPERSQLWLTTCFEVDSESEITQIALWQAYQGRFTPTSIQARPLLAAADFIKNVSSAFPTANAQVIPGTNPRFIIKGIRPRHCPISPKGQVYMRCLWAPPEATQPCGSFYLMPADMYDHIATKHMSGICHDDAGKWDFSEVRRSVEEGLRLHCHWARCQHFAQTGGTTNFLELGMHVKTHLPDASAKAAHRAKHNRARRPDHRDEFDTDGYPAVYETMSWQDTPVNERGEVFGLPLTSALVLRNLARNVPKASLLLEVEAGARWWMERLFWPIKQRLFHVAAVNRTLAAHTWDLINLIEDGRKQ